MADTPIASTSRESRPRMRSQSMHLSSCTPVTLRTEKHRTTSEQRSATKGKGAGKGKKASKKSNKQIEVVSSDSEDLEVDFPNYCPNQPHEEPNPPAEAPAEEQQVQEPHVDAPIKELHHLTNILVGDAGEPQNPGNPNLIPTQPPVLMANTQLNWSHFRPEFSGKPEENVEAHLLRTEDWMTTHNFPEDQKVGRFCLTLTQEDRL